MLLTLENLPLKKEEKQEKIVRWNLAKEGGWKDYGKESEEATEKLARVVEDKSISIEEAKTIFDKIHKHIKYKAFGKVTIGLNKEDKKEKERNRYDGGDT